jgi:hypothetical protein
MKYLKLNFRNAGFFGDVKYTKDFVFDLQGQRKRRHVFKNNKQKVSISTNQISNMLHVLMGERPSATYRNTMIKKIDDIYNVAQKAMIKITTPLYNDKENNKKYYQKESITLRKSVWNSWSTMANLIYWKRIENILTDDEDNSLYLELTSLLSKLLNKDVTKFKATDIALELKNNNNLELIQFKEKLKHKGKKPVINFLDGKDEVGTFSFNERTAITTIMGIDFISRLNGSIIIPMDEWTINKIKQSKGCAKLLDGGVVFIDDLVDGNYIDEDYFEGYININDLEEYENYN